MPKSRAWFCFHVLPIRRPMRSKSMRWMASNMSRACAFISRSCASSSCSLRNMRRTISARIVLAVRVMPV